jgi:RNA polymerase sigma-70 factor
MTRSSAGCTSGPGRRSRWGLSVAAFSAALERSAAKAFGGNTPETTGLERYFDTLHLEDLALACACAEGRAEAWDHFVAELRPALYRAAYGIDSHGNVREIADSIFAELYGVGGRGDERRSLLRYFHGRSSLSTWLRSVLAQRHVDRMRADRRFEPLLESVDTTTAAPASSSSDPERIRYLGLMSRALAHALSALPPRDRLRLGCYYAQDLTLAETGRLLGEHEATVSRNMARTRKKLREDIERHLRHANLSDAEVHECFRSVVDDTGPIDLRELLPAGAERRKLPVDRSMRDQEPKP